MATNVTRMIAVGDLVFADNVRSPECMAIPGIVESYRRNGFKVNHPLVLSEKTDGKYLVLCGNRRGLGLVWLREHAADDFARIVPSGKIPAVVHRGLTQEEEVLLRIDHSTDEDRVPLDEWSVFLAIQQLVQMGMDTQEQIAEKLGITHSKGKNKGQPNRSFIQPRVNLSRLPQFVQDTMRQYTLDKDNTPLRWSHVATLYKAFHGEYLDHPEGDGPVFQEAWKKATTPPVKDDAAGDDADKRKDLTAADAVKRSQAASSKGLATVLLAVTGQGDGNLADVDRCIAEGETAIATLAAIAEYLGQKDFVELVDNSREQAAAAAAVAADETADDAVVADAAADETAVAAAD